VRQLLMVGEQAKRGGMYSHSELAGLIRMVSRKRVMREVVKVFMVFYSMDE